MAQEQYPLTNATGAAMMARLVVRMTKTLARHRMPYEEIEPCVEALMQDMGETFGALGAQPTAPPPFVEKGR